MIQQWYSGACPYVPDYEDREFQLLVAVPCHFDDDDAIEYALLDTAAHWCMLPAETARFLGYETSADPSLPPLHSRFGLLSGRIERVRLTFRAHQGENLVTEATCFISEDWPGPPVLGWKGVLERIRFGVDPGNEIFLFGE